MDEGPPATELRDNNQRAGSSLAVPQGNRAAWVVPVVNPLDRPELVTSS